jgi:hypothetical protein
VVGNTGMGIPIMPNASAIKPNARYTRRFNRLSFNITASTSFYVQHDIPDNQGMLTYSS